MPVRTSYLPSPLRLLMIVLAVVVLTAAFSISRYAHRRIAAIAYAESTGGAVTYLPLPKSRPKWLPALRWLQTVDSIEFSGSAAVDLRNIAPLREVKTISLGEDVLDDGFNAINTFQNLEWVSIRFMLTDSRADILRKCHQIKGLTVWPRSVTDDELRALRGLPVHMIIAKRSAVTDAGLKHLVGLPVEFLVLDDTQVSDSGLRNLSGLPVEFLSLGGTKVTDIGLTEVAKLPTLRRLNLDRTDITDAGIRNLTGMKLEVLALQHTRITDDALATISKLPLRALGVQGTAITRDGMHAFRGMKALKTLHLGDPPFTMDDVNELRDKGLFVSLGPSQP